MIKFWEKFWTEIKWNRGAMLGLTVAIGYLLVIVTMSSCMKTESLFLEDEEGNPVMVGPAQFEREINQVEKLVADTKAGAADLQAQAEQIEQLKAIGAGAFQVAATGGMDWNTALGTIIQGAGVFSAFDALRRRKKITELNVA